MTLILLRKSHVAAYTRKDGTFVAAHNDKRVARPTETTAFRRWFGDSKVVDKDGRPLVVYHGTPAGDEASEGEDAISVFMGRDLKSDHRKWLTAIGDWFTESPEVANHFAKPTRDGAPHVYPVFLSIQNPAVFRTYEALEAAYQQSDAASVQAFAAALEKEGFDGIEITHSDTDVDVVRRDFVPFAPHQVKSATGNSGAFDPASPELTKSHVRAYTRRDGTFVPEHFRRGPERAPDVVQNDLFAQADQDDHVLVDGVRRSRLNASGQPIAATHDALVNFWRWFGDSKVVDDQGRPKVMYHGTIAHEGNSGIGDIHAFDRLFTTTFRGHSVDTMGSWFTDNPGQGGAEMYSASGPGSLIYPVYLSVQDAHETTFDMMLRRARMLASGEDDGRMIRQPEVDAYRSWLQAGGRDGIRIRHNPQSRIGSTEFKDQDAWVVLEPTQVKSAIANVGTFDPENPALTKAHEKPTAAQLEAGNYRKRHVRYAGLDIAIETPAGTIREGQDPNGKKWRTVFEHDYGYIKGTLGVDGDHVDCYLGPEPDAPMVYVVHQNTAGDWDRYDEDKCMLGFPSAEAAKAAYLNHYDDPRFFGGMTAMPLEEFRTKVRATKEKPAMLKSIIFLKAHVGAHTRIVNGKVVQVSAYDDKRVKRITGAPGPGQLDMFKPADPPPFQGKPGAAEHQPDLLEQPGEDLEHYIKIAADSIGELRKVDVDRVLESNPEKRKELAAYISAKRPDLAQEVSEVMEELDDTGSPLDQAPTAPGKDWRDEENWHSRTMERMKTLGEMELQFIQRDATEAAENAEKMGNPKAGQYRDEAHYAAMELKKRRDAKAAGEPEKVKKFYVTMIRDGKPQPAFLAGPFDTHQEALDRVQEAREHAYAIDPRSHFDYFGTSGVTATKHPAGVLNERMGVGQPAAPAQAPAYVPVTDDSHPAPVPRTALRAVPEDRKAEWLDRYRQQHELHHYDLGQVREKLERARSKRNAAETAYREAEAGLRDIRSAPILDPSREAQHSAHLDSTRAAYDKARQDIEALTAQHQSLYERIAKLDREQDKILPQSGDMEFDWPSMSKRDPQAQRAHEKSMLARYREHYKAKDAASKKAAPKKVVKVTRADERASTPTSKSNNIGLMETQKEPKAMSQNEITTSVEKKGKNYVYRVFRDGQEIDKRTSARRYSHAILGRPNYADHVAALQRPGYADTDRSNYRYYQKIAARSLEQFQADESYLNAERNAKVHAEALETMAKHPTPETYLQEQHAARLAKVEKDKADGRFDLDGVYAYAGRPDLAAKEAQKHPNGRPVAFQLPD